MNIAIIQGLPVLLAAIAILGGQVAQAEQFHAVSPDAVEACQSGTKSDEMTLDVPKEIKFARAERDTLDAAVCVSDNSKAAIQATWKANGYWRNSGNITHGCAEVLGASKVMVRPVETNFHGTATYYTCVKE